MSWSPVVAKKVLLANSLVTFSREVDKVSGFVFKSGRELALIQENTKKVSIYVSVAPINMPYVEVDRIYEPTMTKSGRNADVEAVCRTLGYEYQAFSLHIKTSAAFQLLLNWYQYA